MYRSSRAALTAVVLGLWLVGCNMPAPKTRDGQKTESSASFYVGSSAIQITQTKMSPGISLPVAKTFTFKACVVDNKRSKEIINHEFEVSLEGASKSIKTDRQGCLIWSEDIKYNSLATARFVKIERSIKAKGFHKGLRTVAFAINPWEDLAHSLQDTAVDNLVEGQAGAAALAAQDVTKNLWFDDLRLTIEEKKVSHEGVTLNFEFRTQPGVVVEKTSGRRALEPITYGEFDAEISLIHAVAEKQTEVRRLFVNPVKARAAMNSNFLFIEAPLVLNKICTRGQVQLGLKVSARNAPESLRPFEGVFIIGDCDQVKGNSFSRLKNLAAEQNGRFTISDYLTDKTPVGEVHPSDSADTLTDTAQPDYYQRGQIEIRRLSFNNVGYKDQKTILRERVFNITACMRSGLDQKAMRAQTMEIKKVNGENIQIRTNDEGCVSWDDSYKFNYLSRECWKEAGIQISNANLGISQSIQLHINPWSANESFMRDVRFIDSKAQTLVCAQGQSELILTGYDFDKKNYSYEIDSFMNIKVKKTGLLKLSPKLKRPTLTEAAGFVEENLPVGKYLLKWGVADMYVPDLRKAGGLIYQTGSKVIKNNGNSTFVETLTFETKNVKAMGNTNQLVLEIYPLKQDTPENSLELDLDAELAVSVLRGPMVLANNNESGTLEVIEKSGRSIVDSLERQLKQDEANVTGLMGRLGKKEVFIKDAKVEYFSLKDPQSTLRLRKGMALEHWWKADELLAKPDAKSVDVAVLKNWLTTGQLDEAASKALCTYWFFDRMSIPQKQLQISKAAYPRQETFGFQMRSNCLQWIKEKQVEKIFNIHYRYFVKNPKMVEALPITMSKEFSINTAFNLNKSWGESLNRSLSWDVSSGLKFLDIPFLSASTGVRYSVSKNVSDSHGYGTSVSFQNGLSGVMEKLIVKARAEAYEKCAVVYLNANLYQPGSRYQHHLMFNMLSEQERTKILTSGIMICDGEVRNQALNITEEYFVLNQRLLQTQITDPSAEHTRPFFALIRGSYDFNAFMNFLQAQYAIPGTAQASFQNQEMASDKLRAAFRQSIPTYPGQFVVPHRQQ